MNPRLKRTLLLLLTLVLLVVSGQLEKSLNQDRSALGLTISEPLDDAPPVLALTTQALGGFRGLISNFLWIRANDLQINDQYFEAAQLANWITDLEPHFASVWIYQGWNEAYNISVKFKDFSDRWRWVENGIELLRDRGLRYNPDAVLIYRELAWFYQHKMGQNLDDANNYYKAQWAKEMTPFFGPQGTNFDALINPQTPEEKTNALVLREKYKIDPVLAKKVNDQWGPLDWRLPEAHAIYWASLGLQKADENPGKVTQSDLITLRRVIYQSMLQAFQHGRIINNPFTGIAQLGPNLTLIPKVNDAYETEMKEDTNNAEHIGTGHRNFLRDAAYYLYEDNRVADAQTWFKYLGQRYPNKTIIDGVADSYPANVTLDQYAVTRVQGDVNDTSHDATTMTVESMLLQSYESLALGDDDRYAGFRLLARKVYDIYQAKAEKYEKGFDRTKLAPWSELDKTVLDNLLDPVNGLPYQARAIIRSQLRMPAETTPTPQATLTNAIAPANLSAPTNAPATNSLSQ
jgi:hypothetical protein